MGKRLLTSGMSALAAVLVFVAGTGIGVNSWWILYEPDIPECMKNRD